MRYPAGSVSLQYRDKQILHVVADGRYTTHSQLFQLVSLKGLESDRRHFNGRVRRLVRAQLMQKHVVAYLGKDVLYSITCAGIQALEQMGVTFLGGGYVKHHDAPTEAAISHALEVNRIRLALERSQKLSSWIPESLIRVLNLSPVCGYAKVYDAIAKVNVGDGVYAEFALEYERTLKSEARYEKIVAAIESETRLGTFLYLSSSYAVASTLCRHFRGARHEILFAHVDDFVTDVLDTRVESPNTHRHTTLHDALVYRAALSLVSK